MFFNVLAVHPFHPRYPQLSLLQGLTARFDCAWKLFRLPFFLLKDVTQVCLSKSHPVHLVVVRIFIHSSILPYFLSSLPVYSASVLLLFARTVLNVGERLVLS